MIQGAFFQFLLVNRNKILYHIGKAHSTYAFLRFHMQRMNHKNFRCA